MKAALLGKTLRHSFSAEIHGALGTEYELIELDEAGFDAFAASPPVDFFNVTIPYKERIIPFLDELDESAKSVGSVNTVARKDGKLIGYNTDIDGMAYAFSRAGVSLDGATVAVLGSGGTSKTACALARRENAKKVYKISRSGEYNYENVASLSDVEIVINATPVGMFPGDGVTPLEPSIFPRLRFVMDAVYNPLRTALAERARLIGVPSSCGLSMLVYQAIKAEEIWRKEKIDDAITEKIVRDLAREKDDVVLIGMPSCGKTTLGAKVAALTGKRFVDLDAEIEKRDGRRVCEIFAESGEEYFRRVEAEAVKEAGSERNIVLATGGGAPCEQANVYHLRKNGFVVYVKRRLDELSASGRPVTMREGVERLFAERDGVYRGLADAEIENEGDADEVAKEIVRLYEENSRY